MPHAANTVEQLLDEQKLLLKAEDDIEQGWSRLRDQQDLVSERQRTGSDTRQGERLVQLMKQTLVEWGRHRRLIEQRIAYLERETSASSEHAASDGNPSQRNIPLADTLIPIAGQGLPVGAGG
jgi:hypothetical protein